MRADVADLAVTSRYGSAHSGVTHVNLNQRFQDLRGVRRARDRQRRRATAASSSPAAASCAGWRRAVRRRVRLEPTEAVEAAADGLELGEPTDLRVLSQSARPGAGDGRLRRRDLRRADPAAARLAADRRAGSGWRGSSSSTTRRTTSLWNAAVDAETGELLRRRRLDVEGRRRRARRPGSPARRPSTTFSARALAASLTPNPVNDGSSYRVFAFPTREPERRAADARGQPRGRDASPFGWHDTDGAAGPEFTITQGNNVHAYLDQDDNNAMDFGGSPDGGAGPRLRLRGRPDPARAELPRRRRHEPLLQQQHRSTTSCTRYGFDEPSGNFQANNYGRGGRAATTSAPRRPTATARTTPTSRRRRGRIRRHAADADVPLAGQPVRRPEPGRRRRRRLVRRRRGRASAPAPTRGRHVRHVRLRAATAAWPPTTRQRCRRAWIAVVDGGTPPARTSSRRGRRARPAPTRVDRRPQRDRRRAGPDGLA